jgi:hypothetical protein
VGLLSSASVNNSWSTSSVSCGSSCTDGGLIGSLSSGSLTNTFATGSVTGSGANAGGLVGSFSGGTIATSFSLGSVNANLAGGLIGDFVTGSVTDSFSLSSVQGSFRTGGLFGQTAAASSFSRTYAKPGTLAGSSIGAVSGIANGSATNTYAYVPSGTTPTIGLITGESLGSTTYASSVGNGYTGFVLGSVWRNQVVATNDPTHTPILDWICSSGTPAASQALASGGFSCN